MYLLEAAQVTVTGSAFQNQTLGREPILGPAFSEFNYAVPFFSEMLVL